MTFQTLRGNPGTNRIAQRKALGETGIVARVEHLLAVGPVVRVDLVAEDGGQHIHVELPRERQRELGLAAGDRVVVRPRQVRVFAA